MRAVVSLIFAIVIKMSNASSLPEDWMTLLDPQVLAEGLEKAELPSEDPSKVARTFFHGDISVGEDQLADESGEKAPMLVGQILKEYLWPQRNRIPYRIGDFFRPKDKRNIEQALEMISDRTFRCIEFKKRTDEEDYILFQRSPGVCSSYVGRRKGQQAILLSETCTKALGYIQHEVMHALGIFHEQSRPDRDDHVQVLENNIVSIMLDNFDKLPQMETYNLGYDLDSVMHYGFNDFARNASLPTLLPKKAIKAKMGQRYGLSILDAAKLQLAYGCPYDNQDPTTTEPPKPMPKKQYDADRSLLPVSDSNQLDHAVSTADQLNNMDVKKWNNGVVPYTMSLRPPQKRAVRAAMNAIEEKTCIRFREKSGQDVDYVNFVLSSSCVTLVGRQAGKQDVRLKRNDLTSGKIQHALLHTLGFQHEHSRPDRDEFVEINWNNMEEADKKYFRKLPESSILGFQQKYDFESLLHPASDEHAIDLDKYTIRPRAGMAEGVEIGQRKSLSTGDINRIKAAYCRAKVAESPCSSRPGWRHHKTKCYFFSFLSLPDQLMTFREASNECQKIGATLADPADDQETANFIAGVIAEFAGAERTTKVWMRGCHSLNSDAKMDDEVSCSSHWPFVCQMSYKNTRIARTTE